MSYSYYERLLKRLAGHLLSQQPDRGKPLRELWVAEGIEGNRVALITKGHHGRRRRVARLQHAS